VLAAAKAGGLAGQSSRRPGGGGEQGAAGAARRAAGQAPTMLLMKRGLSAGSSATAAAMAAACCCRVSPAPKPHRAKPAASGCPAASRADLARSPGWLAPAAGRGAGSGVGLAAPAVLGRPGCRAAGAGRASAQQRLACCARRAKGIARHDL
jgi:hypothetical protein